MGLIPDRMPLDNEENPPERPYHKDHSNIFWDSVWGWSTGVVMFMAFFFTMGLVALGIACAIHHVLWAAIVLWCAAVINVCYWGSQ